MKKSFKSKIICKLIYVFIAYIVFCITFLFHEYGHSVMAAIFKIKSNPFAIHYSFKPFLMGTHEDVNYAKVFKNYQGILIASAGIFINLILASLFSFIILFNKKISSSKLFFFISYAFLFFNVCDLFNYLTIRNIFPEGDIAIMLKFGFSHQILLISGIAISILFIFLLFKPIQNQFYKAFLLKNQKDKKKASIKIIIIFILVQLGTLYNNFFMY